MDLAAITALALALLLVPLLVVLVLDFFVGGRIPTHPPAHLYPVDHPAFGDTLCAILGAQLVKGNKISTAANGDEAFGAMLSAISHARYSITFETYIYREGRIADKFALALAERAKAGVHVHVLLDWHGTRKMNGSTTKKLYDAGVEVVKFNSPHWYNLLRLNSRTHRKLLVVDGKIGFVGGVGIADEWTGSGDSPNSWSDCHYVVEGPVVNHLQSAFLDNWLMAKGILLVGDAYFPRIEPQGDCVVNVLRSSPRSGIENVHTLYMLSVAAAVSKLRISSAYFVPDTHTRAALIQARRRGVEVEIIVPGPYHDYPLVKAASLYLWGHLLQEGIRIFEFQPTMYHKKRLIVDECWTSVGSTNFDNRSFRFNDEVNISIWSKNFATEQIADFEKDKKLAREVSYSEWRARPLSSKIYHSYAALFRRQL